MVLAPSRVPNTHEHRTASRCKTNKEKPKMRGKKSQATHSAVSAKSKQTLCLLLADGRRGEVHIVGVGAGVEVVGGRVRVFRCAARVKILTVWSRAAAEGKDSSKRRCVGGAVVVDSGSRAASSKEALPTTLEPSGAPASLPSDLRSVCAGTKRICKL